jgi:hypothetical protein
LKGYPEAVSSATMLPIYLAGIAWTFLFALPDVDASAMVWMTVRRDLLLVWDFRILRLQLMLSYLNLYQYQSNLYSSSNAANYHLYQLIGGFRDLSGIWPVPATLK